MKLIDRLLMQCTINDLKPIMIFITPNQGKIQLDVNFWNGVPYTELRGPEQNYRQETTIYDTVDQAMTQIDVLLKEYGLTDNGVRIFNLVTSGDGARL